MSNHYGPDDATEPVGPPPREYPGQQGKLVLRGNQDSYRRPYQYPPSQQDARQRGYTPYPGQPAQTPPPERYGQQGVAAPYRVQPGQMVGTRPKARRRRKGCMIGCLGVLVVVVVLAIFLGMTVPRVLAFGSTISTKAPLSTETNFMNTSERTNLLIMGYGGGNHPGGTLTDSLVVASMIPSTSHTSLVSVPRDLWVQYPPDSGQYTKINAVYEFASNNGQKDKREEGANAAAHKIAQVTGLDVKYWMLVDFNGFKKLIDSIGGIDVYVPDSFNACYPRNDDPTVDAGWMVVDFKKGQQHMDGATAIEYARAREPLSVCGMGDSENLAELTDFGRSARQQIIIKAALSKIQQIGNWPKLFDAMDALQDTIYTNMSLIDLGLFARKMDLNDPKTARIGLSNQNVLMDSTSDDGQYILTAQNNDWNAVAQYVKDHLYQ